MCIANFESQLNEDHPLFKELAGTNAPEWWNKIKKHPKLYIDIRKGNYINVYYYGASIARIEKKRGEKLSAKTHPKYLGYDNKSDSKYYKQSAKDKTHYDPIYQDCINELQNKLDELLKQADAVYVNRNNKEAKNPENISEKKIQGSIILDSRPVYIDSEFAHRYEKDKQKTIRIDLVSLRENRIQFTELKRIQDNRMLHNTEDVPEVLTQLKEYKKFLSINKDAVLDYYKKLLRIKQKLSLPIPDAVIDKIDLDTTPILLIADYMSMEGNDKRKDRKKNIEKKLKEEGVTPEYIDKNLLQRISCIEK